MDSVRRTDGLCAFIENNEAVVRLLHGIENIDLDIIGIHGRLATTKANVTRGRVGREFRILKLWLSNFHGV